MEATQINEYDGVEITLTNGYVIKGRVIEVMSNGYIVTEDMQSEIYVDCRNIEDVTILTYSTEYL